MNQLVAVIPQKNQLILQKIENTEPHLVYTFCLTVNIDVNRKLPVKMNFILRTCVKKIIKKKKK